MSFSPAFSAREKLYIVNWHGKLTNGEIAKNLAALYPEDNGGERTADGVSTWWRTYEREYVPIQLQIDLSLRDKIGDAGLTPADVSFCLEGALRNMLKSDKAKKQKTASKSKA